MSEHAEPRQWRLAQVQLANWGTFDKQISIVNIARKGHLITGPSGSGKSSLLDAIACVLTPDKWLRFNLAAQGSTSRTDQRSLVSYVRGAWTRVTDDDQDRVVSKYLRPGSTWSGIVLRFHDGEGKTLSLARLFFLKGSSVSARDLGDICVLEEAELDLTDLQKYAAGGLETKKFKADHPAAMVTSNGTHGKFYARLRRTFGIENETALQLLHRTQSAKSLDNLDRLFRDFMLPVPDTFAIADTAVQQFGDLRDAHAHVVELRKQRDLLLKLRTASEQYDTCWAKQVDLNTLNDLLSPFLKRRELTMLNDHQQHLRRTLAQKRAQLEESRAEESRAESELRTASRVVTQNGGAEVEVLRDRLDAARNDHSAIENRRRRFEAQLQSVGITRMPQTAEEFAELQTEIAAETKSQEQSVGASYEDNDRLAKARRDVREIEAQILTLRQSGSTVPDNLQRVRQAIATRIGIPAESMPFAAELIEVKPDFKEWTGAIERVLRPFALTMLVRSQYLPAVRAWVDNNEIHGRLVYEEVADGIERPQPVLHRDSLINRIEIADSAVGAWVSWALSVRYNYVCVETPDGMGDHSRAVTIRGQMKTSATRYEKDDRRGINDRSHWVLGDRAGKLSALADRLKEAQEELNAAQEVVDTANRQEQERNIRRGRLESILDGSWAEYDTISSQKNVDSIEQRLATLTSGDETLSRAVQAEQKARETYDAARRATEDTRHEVRMAERDLEVCEEKAGEIKARIAAGELEDVPEDTATRLEERLRREKRAIRLDNIHEVGQRVSTALQKEKDTARDAADRASHQVTQLTTEFKERWEAVASDLMPGVEDRAGFLRILDEILTNGLPTYETRFRKLLQERSQDLVGELLNEIMSAPNEIRDRVVPINSALARKPFDEARFLHLRVKTQRSAVVEDFMGQLRTIVDGSWDDQDMQTAESKYAVLAEIMRRFDSGEHVDTAWRRQCLDTRTHVKFLADEVDEHGTVRATYDSGAAMSGGQQQKLVVFCLAAALRYQLAQRDDDVPLYGTVILDEAFDKADTRYTRMALDIFVEFGFHLVLATPQKLLQTIEPYVGAVTEIDNPTRQLSTVADIDWSGHTAGDSDARS